MHDCRYTTEFGQSIPFEPWKIMDAVKDIEHKYLASKAISFPDFNETPKYEVYVQPEKYGKYHFEIYWYIRVPTCLLKKEVKD